VASRVLQHISSYDRVFYEHFNNFLIFRNAFFHLIQQKDLYLLYKQEAWDLFKYSPAFALFMAPIAVLPKLAGVMAWDFLNAFVLFLAIGKMPWLKENKKIILVWFIIIELMTSLQNSQSNALIAGLLVFAFNAFEKRKPGLASLLIVSTVFIKLFGAAAFSLFLLYPGKRKFITYTIVWTIVLSIVPLIVVPYEQLLQLYKSWYMVLTHDFSMAFGLSVIGWLHSWFHLGIPKSFVSVGGIALFCLPFLKYRLFIEPLFRIRFLASILIWVVIFNHMAESPTFIIAMTGVGIWYFTQKRTIVNFILLISAFILTSLSPTDVFPALIRKTVVGPYTLKAVPCIFIWFKLIYDLLTTRVTNEPGFEQQDATLWNPIRSSLLPIKK
jgi:hypothetical protein